MKPFCIAITCCIFCGILAIATASKGAITATTVFGAFLIVFVIETKRAIEDDLKTKRPKRTS